MREIKFRAFGKKSDLPGMHYFNLDQGNWCKRSRDLIVMQDTGLRDKSGEEIYEGDILDFDEEEWGEQFTPEVVVWENIIGIWNMEGTLEDVCRWRKVIGNIHENPELLERL